jgi:hypothetical protein
MVIEDYYDEYAVDNAWRGFQHVEFQEEYLDDSNPEDPIYYEQYLRDHKHYLGEPLTEDPYPSEHLGLMVEWPKYIPHYVDQVLKYDLIYREFDRGLVICHLGLCGSQDENFQIDLDQLDLLDHPAYSGNCPGDPCHFVKIIGSGSDMYDDGTNDGEHITDGVFEFSLWSTEFCPDPENLEHAGENGIILLKEGDGFDYHPDGHASD